MHVHVRTHTPTFMSRYTHSFSSICLRTHTESAQPQFSNRTLVLTQVCIWKKGPMVSLHGTEMFGFWPQRLHRSSSLFFLAEGQRGGWAKWNPVPQGHSKGREQCWNKWFMLLSSQVNSAALSAITTSFSGQKERTKLQNSALLIYSFCAHFKDIWSDLSFYVLSTQLSLVTRFLCLTWVNWITAGLPWIKWDVWST